MVKNKLTLQCFDYSSTLIIIMFLTLNRADLKTRAVYKKAVFDYITLTDFTIGFEQDLPKKGFPIKLLDINGLKIVFRFLRR